MAAEKDHIGHQDGEHEHQCDNHGSEGAGHGTETGGGRPEGDGTAQGHDLAVEAHAGNDRPTQQCGEIEDVRADDDPGADGPFVWKGGDRRGDLRGVGREGGHHSEQRLGEPEALAHPLQRRDNNQLMAKV